MTRILYSIKLTITLEAPYLIHGNDPGRHGLDATLLRDHRGRPILPGTLLQGRIAEGWKTLSKQLGDTYPEEWGTSHEKWFGKPGNDPQRARLRVQDLMLKYIGLDEFNPKAPQYHHDITRIELEEARGAVKSNALLNIEQLCAAGADLEFAGDWQVWAEASEIMLLKHQIHAALLLQTQLGAYRSVGFGRIKSVIVAEPEAQLYQDQPLKLSRRMALSLADPICVSARSRRGNVFESGDIIPGGAILGALADMLKAKHGVDSLEKVACYRKHADYLLAKHFDQLRCTHALPSVRDGKRPLPLPKSLVKCDGDFWDAFRHSSAPDWLKSAPAFQTDWKDADFTKAGKQQGWASLKHHLRLRTAIEAGQAKKSGQTPDGAELEKGSLFAYDCVYAARDEPDEVPGKKTEQMQSNKCKEGDEVVTSEAVKPQTKEDHEIQSKEPDKLQSNWQFDLYLPASALDKDGNAIPDVDRHAINQSLASLLARGLAPIGKTGAGAKVLPVASAQDQWPSHSGFWKQGNLVPVLLVSDALLCTTEPLLNGAVLLDVYKTSFNELVKIVLALDTHQLFQSVRASFKELIDANKKQPPAIELSHFFATQKLQGGGYLNKRFGEDKSYQPMVLTEVGSVFVFKVNDPIKAKKVFDHWRENGLPLSPAVIAAYGNTWEKNPFLPNNGYGEVSIAPKHKFTEL